MFPNLSENLMKKIFRSSSYNIAASIDLSLKLMEMLEAYPTDIDDIIRISILNHLINPVQHALPIWPIPSASKFDPYDSQEGFEGDLPIVQVEPIPDEYSQSKDILSSSIFPSSSEQSLILSPENEKEIENEETSSVASNSLISNRSGGFSYRGVPIILQKEFLLVPKFRLVVESESIKHCDFSISFHLSRGDKFGMRLRKINRQIIVYRLSKKQVKEDGDFILIDHKDAVRDNQRKKENKKGEKNEDQLPIIAHEAGLRVGDVVRGIDGDYFSGRTEIDDVSRRLSPIPYFVTIHFRRFSKMSVEESDSRIDVLCRTYHRLSALLMDLEIISSKNQASFISFTCNRIIERGIQFIHGMLSSNYDENQMKELLYSQQDSTSRILPPTPRNLKSFTDDTQRSLSFDSHSSDGTVEDDAGFNPFPNTPVRRRRSSRRANSESKVMNEVIEGIDFDIVNDGNSDDEEENEEKGILDFILSSSLFSSFSESDVGGTPNKKSATKKEYDDNDRFQTKELNPDSQYFLSPSHKYNCVNTQSINTTTIRPGLIIRILEAEYKYEGKYTEYNIWVLDILSGCHWKMKRRFSEFYTFRNEVGRLRSSVLKIPFPSKKSSLTTSYQTVIERREFLEHFLRRIESLPSLNSLHPSILEVSIKLQDFLGVTDRLFSIKLVENEMDVFDRIRNGIQVHVNRIMAIGILDSYMSKFLRKYRYAKVLPEKSTFSMEKLRADWENGCKREGPEYQLIQDVSSIIDYFQNLIIDGCENDLLEITEILIQHENIQLPDDETNCGNDFENEEEDEENDGRSSRIRSPRLSSFCDTELSNLEDQEFRLSKKSEEDFDNSNNNSGGGNDGNNIMENLNTDQLEDDSLEEDWELEFDEEYYLSAKSSNKRLKQLLMRGYPIMSSLINDAVRRHMEFEIYVPLKSKIISDLSYVRETSQSKLQFALKFCFLKYSVLSSFCFWFIFSVSQQLTQEENEIHSDFISPSNWALSIKTLSSISYNMIPFDSIMALVRACKTIPFLFLREHPNTNLVLGADDFFPIFIFILSHTEISNLDLIVEIMSLVVDPEKKMSEMGYYLATLGATVEHLKTKYTLVNI